MSTKISVAEEKCTGCGLCLQICTLGNFAEGDDKKVHATDGLTCFSCGHCVAVCPSGAISHSDLDPNGFQKLDESARPSYDQFLNFLKLRRSRREFKPDPVPHEEIEKLLLAAVQAPSAINNQSVQFTAITQREIVQQISDICIGFIKQMNFGLRNPIIRTIFKLTKPSEFNDLKKFLPIIDCMFEMQTKGFDMVTYNAPCMIFLHAPKNDMFAAMDAVYNAENILLAVETLGLGACEIGFVTEPANRGKEIRDLAHIPQDHRIFSSIVVGYPKFKYTRAVPKKKPVVKFV